MKNTLKTLFVLFAATLLLAGCASPVIETNMAEEPVPVLAVEKLKPVNVAKEPETVPDAKTMILINTSKGDIKIELDAAKAPKTVANFMKYVESGHYNGTIFHRIIDGFMIQGGGFTPNMVKKDAPHTVENESSNGLKNDRGTIAMARLPSPHSASAQFFINVVDNEGLNRPKPDGWGYCVFGQVIEGMEVVDAIKGVPTGRNSVPVEPIVITNLQVID